MKRRQFLAFAAATPALRAAPAMSLGKIPIRRVGKVEIVFKSPGPQPNGLQATKDGLWIIHVVRLHRTVRMKRIVIVERDADSLVRCGLHECLSRSARRRQRLLSN